MQRRVVILVPVSENCLEQILNLQPEVFLDPHVVALAEQVLELTEHILVLSGVEPGLLLAVEVLDLEEQLQEAVIALDDVEVDGEECLQSLVAVGELVHRSVVHRVALVLILLLENLIVSGDNVS